MCLTPREAIVLERFVMSVYLPLHFQIIHCPKHIVCFVAWWFEHGNHNTCAFRRILHRGCYLHDFQACLENTEKTCLLLLLLLFLIQDQGGCFPVLKSVVSVQTFLVFRLRLKSFLYKFRGPGRTCSLFCLCAGNMGWRTTRPIAVFSGTLPDSLKGCAVSIMMMMWSLMSSDVGLTY